MYDVRLALTDMAHQLKACRARDGLTLQQLATRCGVAASTIHKIEAQQMVPTVSVLLKISRGLGCRPGELVRDREHEMVAMRGADGASAEVERGIGAWRIDYMRGERLGPIALEPGQRAILLVERGQGECASDTRRTRLLAGECVELEGEPFRFSSEPGHPAAVLLIVSPAGRLAAVLGAPNAAPRVRDDSSHACP